MMQHQVNVSARFNPETLERVLRVVRHRGFHVCSMNCLLYTSPSPRDTR